MMKYHSFILKCLKTEFFFWTVLNIVAKTSKYGWLSREKSISFSMQICMLITFATSVTLTNVSNDDFFQLAELKLKVSAEKWLKNLILLYNITLYHQQVSLQYLKQRLPWILNSLLIFPNSFFNSSMYFPNLFVSERINTSFVLSLWVCICFVWTSRDVFWFQGTNDHCTSAVGLAMKVTVKWSRWPTLNSLWATLECLTTIGEPKKIQCNYKFMWSII